MKAAVLGFFLAFLMSGAVTTAVLVRRAGQAVPAPAVARSDAAGAAADSGQRASGDAGTSALPDSAVLGDAAGIGVPGGGPLPGPAAAAPVAVPAPAVRPVLPTVDPAARAAAYKQVARVLSAMKAAEAAKVLAHLSDAEVEGILRAVGPRQAADFLTNIPKERAAALSRRLLVPRPSISELPS